MVTYCCVKDCRNNSSEKKKSHRVLITFHAFPTNPEARSKWLKAIGRPSWDPPSHARVCSVHFNHEQINREHQRTRLKDDACPVRKLPANSYFEATEMEVCRICLVTDVKMFSLLDEVLKICIKSVTGFNRDIEGMPQYVCYECAFQLLKCYSLVEKSLIAKTTLLNIFSKNGEVTKHLVRSINRSQLNLQSSLTQHNVIPKTIVNMQYDEDLHKYIYTSQIEENISKKEDKKTIQPIKKSKNQNDSNSTEDKFENDLDYKVETNLDLNTIEDYKIEESSLDDKRQPDNFVNMNEELKDDIFHCDTDCSENSALKVEDEAKSDEDQPLINIKAMKQEMETEIVKIGKKKRHKTHKTKRRIKTSKHSNGLTPDEVEMEQYFNIVILTLEEQIEDRERMRESASYRDALYKCDVCYKTYLHPDAFKMHLQNHDPSRGRAECPVCRLRYKNDVLVKSHAYRTHGKKFYCKSCPKVFNNVRIAKKHQKRHEGFVYKCPLCDFSTLHESAYGAHARTQHPARHVCARCGHAFVSERGLRLHTIRTHPHQHDQLTDAVESTFYRCKDCDIYLSTESAWRVHMLTSTQHKTRRNFNEPTSSSELLSGTCPRCGEQFATSALLQQHKVDAHAHPRPAAGKKVAWRSPGDCYPATCEHCGETVNNRKEHYFHVRKMHPKERDSYQPVITAVCDTCGKGFQNSTKLHLHELRHKGVGTVRCPHCPRLFYDKYQLARHIGVHSDDRPYKCTLCEKAFKLRSNLDRHAKVHSGATPYECTMCGKRFRYSSSRNLHVRTVHYKMPHPPRKKRPHKLPRTGNSYENCLV